MYTDPDLKHARHPGQIDRSISRRMLNMLDGARWSRNDMLHFIGEELSTPKPHVVYAPPGRALSPATFKKTMSKQGLRLAPQSLLLYDDAAFYINGERWALPVAAHACMRSFADHRALPPATLPAAATAALYAWYRAGYATF